MRWKLTCAGSLFVLGCDFRKRDSHAAIGCARLALLSESIKIGARTLIERLNYGVLYGAFSEFIVTSAIWNFNLDFFVQTWLGEVPLRLLAGCGSLQAGSAPQVLSSIYFLSNP